MVMGDSNVRLSVVPVSVCAIPTDDEIVLIDYAVRVRKLCSSSFSSRK